MALRDQIERALSGAYVIERELTGGGMSRVFLANEVALQRQVVIKLLPPELSGGINLERFTREIQLAAKLHHPHIVPVFTAGDVAGSPYFTMPFVEGESLRTHLSRGELPVAETVSILRDVSKALVYAHAHGVVHRDIKPDNVLLAGHAAAVTDFGVAKALTDSSSPGAKITETGMALGTPSYMAPEQASADPNVDHRADIYAFGVLAFEMLTGRPPFAGRPPQQILAAHLTEPVPPVQQTRESIPAALADLVNRCLAKRPADRPQKAEDLLHALESIATPSGGVPPVRAKRSSTPWIVGGLAVAAVVVALVVYKGKARSGTETVADTVDVAQAAAPIVTPSAPHHRPTRIVVAPFANMTGDTSLNVLGAITAEAITNSLSQLDSLSVVSAASSQLDSSGRLRRFVSADAARALGRESKASTVVYGTIFKEGDSLRFGGQMMNVSDGRVEVTLDVVHALAKSPNAAIEKLRDQLVTTLDARGLKDRLGSLGRTPNPASYREFLAGLHEVWDPGGAGYHAAASHFRAAAALDSTFIYPPYYVILEEINITRNTPSRDTALAAMARADSVLSVLASRQSTFTALERDLYDEAVANAHFDAERGLRADKRLLARDSSMRMVGNAAYSALDANRPYEAMAILRTWPVSNMPVEWTARNWWARAYHMTGRYAEGLRFAEATRRGAPDWRTFFTFMVEFRAALGDSASLQTTMDSVVRVWTPADTLNPGNQYLVIVRELRAHGYESKAIWFARQGLAWVTSRPKEEFRQRATQQVNLLIAAQMYDSATAIAKAAQLPPAGQWRLAIQRGDSAPAIAQLVRYDSMATNKYDHGVSLAAKARVLADLGRKEDAVRALREALQRGTPFNWTWHSDPDFYSMRDYPPFVALLRPKDGPGRK